MADALKNTLENISALFRPARHQLKIHVGGRATFSDRTPPRPLSLKLVERKASHDQVPDVTPNKG